MMDNDESGSVEKFTDKDYRVEFDVMGSNYFVYSVVGKVILIIIIHLQYINNNIATNNII